MDQKALRKKKMCSVLWFVFVFVYGDVDVCFFVCLCVRRCIGVGA